MCKGNPEREGLCVSAPLLLSTLSLYVCVGWGCPHGIAHMNRDSLMVTLTSPYPLPTTTIKPLTLFLCHSLNLAAEIFISALSDSKPTHSCCQLSGWSTGVKSMKRKDLLTCWSGSSSPLTWASCSLHAACASVICITKNLQAGLQ